MGNMMDAAMQLVTHYFAGSIEKADITAGPPAPTLILRARSGCDAAVKALWTKAQAGDRFVFDQALLCLHFKVLFADSTAELQQAMDAVLSSFEDESHPMHRRFPHEILYAACYQLLEVHAKHERVPPAVFRRLLQRALDVFP